MAVSVIHQYLEEWARTDPARLLATAHEQADRLGELYAQLEELRLEREQDRRRIEELQAQNQSLQTRIRELESENEELRRAAARQAAPFRVPEHKRVAAPRRPGRRPGHPGVCRPVPDHVDEHVEVSLEKCPHCGGPVEDCRPVEQYLEDLPVVRPRVIHLKTWEGRCRRCKRRVRSTHPLQISTARGAAGVHLGPRALAVAAWLNKVQGLTMRKTTRLLQTIFGLRLTPGGLAQALHRVGKRLKSEYQALQTQLRQLPAVYTDETSWWIGGSLAWLRVFTSPQLTVYLLDDHRDRATVHEVLGASFPGVLVSDCLSIYEKVCAVQHKCYAHHLKAIREAMRAHPQGGQGYLEQLRGLLKAAQALKGLAPDIYLTPAYAAWRQALEQQADQLLALPRLEPWEERIRRRLAKQREHLFTFLDYPEVEATNNLAERQLRPAVITRKLSCGNKTRGGADTWQIIVSVAVTCQQRQQCFLQRVMRAMSLAPPLDSS